jgi:tetratricopeptide (TPR) repeat protein
MKFIRFSSVALVSLLFVGCGDPAEQSTITQEERIPVVLSIGDLFQGNKIMAFLENEEKFIKEANELFLKGLDAFRNKKDLDSADHYFRMSILKEPTSRAYFELANLHMDKEDYETALMSYGLAEQLDYQPLSKIMYNKSCLYALQGKHEMAGQYLEYALQSGYNNLDHIDKDEDLESLRETGHYQKAIDRGLRGMSNAENLYWLQFKNLFAKSELPQTLSPILEDQEVHDLKYISYDYEKYISEMRDEQFSREVSKGFYYYSQPYENENFVAVVYIVKDEFMGDYAPLSYVMGTFTHDGKLIDKKQIAGGGMLSDPFMESTLNPDMTIDVQMLEPEYEKDPDEYGYWENKLVKTTPIGTKSFKISKSGKISESEMTELAQQG